MATHTGIGLIPALESADPLLVYRSPWSNKYDPHLEDGAMPSDKLRQLEVDANQAFDQYREMYFEGGVSSVYLWDLDHGFAGVILIKKAGDGSKKIKGCWDSIHVVEVQVRLPSIGSVSCDHSFGHFRKSRADVTLTTN